MAIWKRLLGTFKRGSEIQQEIEFHMEQRASELTAEGLDPKEALRQARLEFGNPSKWREETRDADVFLTIETVLRDARQSLRGLRQRPVFAATAIASLALGIGAVASLFAIADAVIWKPVALPGEGDLYVLEETKRGVPGNSNGPRLKDWQTLTSISAATGTYGESLVWRGADGNEAVRCLRTYTGLMATFQPPLAMGRGFSQDEEGGAAVALVTNAFWRNRLNSGPLGPIQLSGRTYQIVGVLASSVGYPDGYQLWIPAPAGLQKGSRDAGYLDILIRLKSTAAQTQAEIQLMAKRLSQAYPKSDADLAASIAPLQERISRSSRTSLYALLAVVACVLTMICVNVAALLLSRGTERERESSLRSALGASPASLVRLYLTEAFLLALAGGALGVILALGGVDVLKHVLPGQLPRLADAQVDARVLGFAFLLSLVAALAAGLIPAWLAARKTALHDSARGASARADRKHVRTVFVVVEIALSVLLVTTSVRLGQAFLELSSRPTGFRTADVLTFSVPFPWTFNEKRLAAFTDRALERFRALPGVTEVGLTDNYPLLGGTQDLDIQIEGVTSTQPIHTDLRAASPGYFQVLSVPVLDGRMFDSRKRPEVVVNATFAKRYFTDGRPAAAHRVTIEKGSTDWYEVVGVIADIPTDPAKSAPPEVFTHYANTYWPSLDFAIRTTAPSNVLAPLIREEVAKLEGSVIVKNLMPLQDKIGESIADTRIRSTLVGAASLLALLLMAIGIHGLVAGDVATRWREFGIRLALGASVPSIRGMLLRKIALLAAMGVGAGITGVLLTSSLLAASFEGLPPVRVLTIVAVCGAIGMASLTAVLWPLYRVARIDPASALRHE